MTSDGGGEEARGIGARLRAAREKKGLTLLQAAEKLHLDLRVLEALEAQNFEALGADVYVRGHLRHYAETVGESPAQLQELYAAAGRTPPPDLTRIPRRSAAAGAPRLLLPALLVVIVFGLAGILWWVLSLQAQKAQPVAAAPAAPEAPSEPAVAAGGAPAAAGAAAGSVGGALAAEAPAPGEARLGLSFTAASWVEVSDANGRRLLQGLMDRGSGRTLAGAAPLRVTLGNAPAVSIELNGRPVALGGLVRRDGSAHLLIDGSGHASMAPPRLAHGD